MTGNDKSDLSFWGHLEVLRWMLLRVIMMLSLIVIACFTAMPRIFDSVVMAPTSSSFFLYRWLSGTGGDGIFLPDFSGEFNVEIININVASQFMTHITTSFCFAMVIVFPYMIFEIWRFISPALFDNERKSISVAFISGTLMFYLGCITGYSIVFPFTFRFLTQYEISSTVTNQISLNSYMDNFIMIIFIMGVVFELPLLAWVLSKLGIVSRSLLKEYRRYAVISLLILAAIITPSGDPFTLLIVFLPLYILYEVGIRFASDSSGKSTVLAEFFK